jgi:penicillin-binding protein 1A
VVFAEDATVLGKYYIENRVPVAYDELSPNLVKALIATEDERYYDHSGIDFEALARAVTKRVFLGNTSAGGASTISQQLAKLLFTENPGNGFERVKQKMQEWVIATRLERKYTKEEIMAMYLNKFNFINGAYGIKAASEIYFGKHPSELAMEEAAMLVGMLKNPSRYNPRRFQENTKKRREVVLKQMQRNGYIDQVAYDSLRVKEMDMTNFNRKTHADGLAPYFRMELRKELKRILENETERKSNGKPFDIYRDGFKIYTTIDPKIQAHAESSMLEHMKELQTTFNARWKNEDPWTYREEPNEELNEPGTSDEEMAARAYRLDYLIFDSDRAKAIREKTLAVAIKGFEDELDGFTLRDVDVRRMLEEKENKGYLRKLRQQKMIGEKLEDKYKKFIKSDSWVELQDLWNKYKKNVQKSFEEEAEMKVFTYENAALEKDTVMTPLDSLKYHRNFLQTGMLAVDPISGYIKAWVGGINHKYFQYDHVTSDRQTGSTFKPFVYATAIQQQGFSPCYEVDDIAYTIHTGEANFGLLQDWSPQNAGKEFSGDRFSLFKGLMWSKNTVSVYLMKQLGDVAPVRELVSNLGIDIKKVPPVPSICLGAADLSVYDMTGAYTAFANNGIYNKPVFIKRIEDKYGKIIYEGIREDRPALDPRTNYVMIEMLRSVMRQGLRGFGGIKSDMGGKTGTTNDYVDGWFMGLTPNLVVGTWVGGEERWIRFRTLGYGIGAKMARPMFAKFIRKMESDEEVDFDVSKRFVMPEGDLGIELDCDVYKRQRGDIVNDSAETGEGFGGDGIDNAAPIDSVQLSIDEEEFGEDF